jgi:hypothetical protein
MGLVDNKSIPIAVSKRFFGFEFKKNKVNIDLTGFINLLTA